MNRAELKAAAKEQIRGKIGVLFLISLVTGLISGAVGAIPVVGSVASTFVVAPAFSLSMIYIYLNVVKGQHPAVGDAFSGFSDFWSAFKVTFLTGLFTMLWSLLFIIPGIIKAFSYSMAMYILAENPGKPALECIEESKRMTQGHKMELFVLGLSFIGWALLCGITFGIAYIWVGPYMQATYVNAYHKLKNNADF
jgi:uncharacterized membrane protein